MQYEEKSKLSNIYFFISVGIRKFLDGLFISSLLMGLWSFLFGGKTAVIFLTTALLAILFRLALWSFDRKRFDFIPEYDLYRIHLLEQKVNQLSQ